MPTIEEALFALADRDHDHASIRNAEGFNGRDSELGNSLARWVRSGRDLTPRQAQAAYRMLRTYRGQLARYGIDFESIPPPAPAPKAAEGRGFVEWRGKDNLHVRFDGFPSPGALSLVRAVPGRKWHKPSKLWLLPLTVATAEHVRLWPDHVFTLSEDVQEWLTSLDREQVVAAAASRATEAGLELDPEVSSLTFAEQMYPFQRAGVAYALAHRRVLIGDQMGLGKTVQAIATIAAESRFPAVIVVPAVVKLNWEREIKRWMPGWTVEVLSGRTPHEFENPAAFYVVNYDILPFWVDALRELGPGAVVFDEAHYVKNRKTKRAKASKQLASDVEVRLALTGTPILNRPVELVGPLEVLGRLDDMGGFWGFVQRYCGAKKNPWGWDFTGATNLPELHEKLRRLCMVRRTKAEVLDELPAKTRAIVPMELSDRAAYEKVKADIAAWYEERLRADEAWLHLIEDLDPEDAEYQTLRQAQLKADRARNAEAMVKITALKGTCARLKLPAVIEWIETFLESGEKLVLFAHHLDVIDKITRHFVDKGVGVATVTGDSPAAFRQIAVDNFQTNPEVVLFVGQIQAAGVGITLTAASNVAFVELPWRPGDLDQAEDRVYARLNDLHGVTAWYLLADRTIEERIATMLDAKRSVVELTSDGTDEAASLAGELMAAITKGDE